MYHYLSTGITVGRIRVQMALSLHALVAETSLLEHRSSMAPPPLAGEGGMGEATYRL